MCSAGVKPIHCVLRVALGREQTFWGSGVAMLLHGIEECQSLRASAQHTGISYTKAWKIVHRAERELGFLLVESESGGVQGGGSRLTEQAVRLLTAYDAAVDEAENMQKVLFEKYFESIL